MKKGLLRVLSSLLIVVMIVSSAALAGFVGLDFQNWANLFTLKADAATYSGKCGGNLTWTLDDETGVLNISGTGDMYNWLHSSSIPWVNYRSSIKTVVIGDNVTSIGKNAFNFHTNLTSVTIGKGVKSIGEVAFCDCTSLTSVTIQNSLKSIGDSAFWGCESLTNIIIPDSVTSIGDSAFRWCESLKSVTIGNSVVSIGVDAFRDTALYNNSSKWENKVVLYIGNYLIKAKHIISNKYIIKYGTKTIADSAFECCYDLTSVTIPDSVTSIGMMAFGCCYDLTSVTIGNSVRSIGSNAFYWCYGLTSITVAEDNPNYSSDEYGVLFNKDKTKLIKYPVENTRESYTIPDSVTSISSDAFSFCHNLTSLKIGNSVTDIYYGAFLSCNSITDVYYNGTEEDWNEISVGSNNDGLINATIHFCFHSSYTEHTTPATCETDGESYKICDDCGKKFDVNVIPATGKHIYTSKATDVATCCSTGTKKYTCITCDHYYTETIAIDSSNHTGGTKIRNAKSATCGADGYTGDVYCKGCSALITAGAVIPATGEHTYTSSVTSVPTCCSIGTKKYTCTTCDHSYTETIAKDSSNHTCGTEIRNSKNVACDEDGYTGDTHCKGCLAVLEQGTTIPALGHTASEWEIKKEATYFAPGEKVRKCTRCQEILETAEIPQLVLNMSIRTPSTTTIKYGDLIILHVDFEGTLPEVARVAWTADNGNFSMSVSEDGTTCEISPKSSGKTTFTATVYDKDGNEIASGSQEMTSKAGFFNKIGAFFRKIFGLLKVIPYSI